MREKLKIFYFSIIAALSSFLFGLFLTSEGVLYPKLKENFIKYNINWEFSTYAGLFASIVFLGAFVSSYFNYFFNDIDRKYILITNNIFYILGNILILYYKNIYILLVARFVIGLGAGISCCTVPSYIFSVTNDRNRGFYMSFHSIGIVLGLVVGKILGYYYTYLEWRIVYIIILFVVLFHTLGLCVIKNCPSISCGNYDTTITQLLKDRRAWKSVFLGVIFHIAQHACGIDYFTIFSEKILENENNAEKQGIYTLAFSAVISILCCNFIDKIGRKFFLCLSTFILFFSTLVMGFNYINIPITYLYLFGFNIGMSSIPWFITNEIFPVEYIMPAMRLTIGVNWMSAFLLSFVNMPMHLMFGHYFFLFYAAAMAIFLIFVIALFKETKNLPIGFQ